MQTAREERSWNKNLPSTGGSGNSLNHYVLSEVAAGEDVMNSFCRIQFSILKFNPYYVHKERMTFAWSVSRNNYFFFLCSSLDPTGPRRSSEPTGPKSTRYPPPVPEWREAEWSTVARGIWMDLALPTGDQNNHT